MSFENAPSHGQSSHASEAPNLSAIVERPDETTEKKLMSGQAHEQERDYSPNGLNTLRSDAKMIRADDIPEDANQSAGMGLDDSRQYMSPSKAGEKPEDRSILNPSYLSKKLGAVMKMMERSAFVAASLDENRIGSASRLGSASTIKSRADDVPASRLTQERPEMQSRESAPDQVTAQVLIDEDHQRAPSRHSNLSRVSRDSK